MMYFSPFQFPSFWDILNGSAEMLPKLNRVIFLSTVYKEKCLILHGTP